MDKDLKQEVGGKAQNIKGRVEEAVGAVTGNKKTEAQGVADRIAGAAREKVAEVKRGLSTPKHGHADETESNRGDGEKADDE